MEDRYCDTTWGSLTKWLREASLVTNSDEATKCCDNLRILSCEPGRASNLFSQAVQICVDLMHSFNGELCVQNSGLLAMAALSEKQQLSALIGERGGVQQLLDAWMRFSHDDVLVKNSIVTMRSLSDIEQNRLMFCAKNGVETLTDAMKTFSNRTSIQIAAAALLANLCFESEERKQQVIQNNAVALLMDSLRRFNTTQHFRLHANTCLALRNISVDKPGCDEILARDRDLHTIIRVLETNFCHSSTAKESLGVLLNLAVYRHSKTFAQSCLDSVTGSIATFLKRTLRQSQKYDECHETCFAAIRFLVSSNPTMPLCQRQDICRLAVLYTKEYLSCNPALSVTIITTICRCLRVMLIDSENRRCFSQTSDGVQTLVQCISFLSNRPLHVEHALIAMGNAVFDCSHGKEEVRKFDGIRIVHEVLSRHYYIPSVAEASLLAIQGICSMNERNGHIATEHKLHHTCVQTMNCFRDNAALQERGLAALLSLGTSSDAVRELSNLSALEVAHAAVIAFPFSRAIAAQEAKIRTVIDASLPHTLKDRFAKRKKSLPLQGWKPFSHG